MTLMSRLLSLFPAYYFLSSGFMLFISLLYLSAGAGPESVLVFGFLIFNIYLMPPFLFRLHQLIFPIKEGLQQLTSSNGKPKYNAWWGGHQLQVPFIALPQLESVLRLFPGVYSMWLRLWGAKIGKNVYWTPRGDILDRPLIRIGSNVVVGYDYTFYAHIIQPSKKSLRLFVGAITIGSNCLLGGKAKLGPGVAVLDGVQLPYDTLGKINQTFSVETIDASESEKANA
jgi:hypothetical protein